MTGRRPRRKGRPDRTTVPDHGVLAESLVAEAETALARRQRVKAAALLHQAGDAFRRDDRPARAAQVLTRSLALTEPSDPQSDQRRATARVLLAGVLADAGQLDVGTDVARQVLAGPVPHNLSVLAHDVLASLLLGQARVDEARAVVAELAQLAPDLPVLPFRYAALARLDGDLNRADALLMDVLRTSPRTDAWRGPRAAAGMERAEIALLMGRLDDSIRGFAEAVDAWAAVGRRAGGFRAAAGQVRAALADGQTPLPSVLDGPVDYAAQRQMPTLEAEVRMARGSARQAAGLGGAREDLDRAVGLAEGAGAVFLEGRARCARRALGWGGDDLLRTRLCLASDRVWSQRVPADP